MKKYINKMIKAFAAGCMICIAAIVYLRAQNNVVGSCLFAFGLLTILVCRMSLFTGVIGYAIDKQHKNKRSKYLRSCFYVWLGNLIGCCAIAEIYKRTSQWTVISDRVNTLISSKAADSNISLFCLGVLCGILMFIAVHIWKNDKIQAPVRVCMVFLPVMVFILSGYEHSIADMAYMALSTNIDAYESIRLLSLVTIGNSVGGMCACFCINKTMQ